MFHSKLRPAFTATALSAVLLCGVQEVAAGTRTQRNRESRARQAAARVDAISSWTWLFSLVQKAGARLDPNGRIVSLEGQQEEDPEPVQVVQAGGR